MQRLGTPWSLNRRSTVRQPFHQIVRHAGKKPWPRIKTRPMRPVTANFNINSLLLDLDAEHAEHVRQYDPDIDGTPEGRYAKKDRDRAAIGARIQVFLDSAKQDSDRFERIVRNRSYERHINDSDIIYTALERPKQKHQSIGPTLGLLDNATDPPTCVLKETRHEGHGDIIRWNGIRQNALQDPAKLLKYMLHQQEEAQTRSKLGSADSTWDGLLCEVIHKQRSLLGLKRVVQFLLDTPNGSQLLSTVSGVVGEKCQKLAYGPQEAGVLEGTSTRDLLFLCNNIVMNLLARAMPVKRQLWDFGLNLAVRYSAFSAARMHLAAGLKTDGDTMDMQSYLSRPLTTILRALEAIEQDPMNIGPMDPLSRHPNAIFSFLTGHDINGHHSLYSVHNSMIPLASSNSGAFHSYIKILGELGALRTLWHVYQRLPQILPENNTHNPAAMIARAFSRIVRSAIKGQVSVVRFAHESATGNFEADCQLDLQTIRQSFRTTTQPFSDRNPKVVTAIFGTILEKDVLEAFGKADIKQSLAALQELLRVAVAASREQEL
ncbi:hypothetical protein AB5N19_06645 [Seiridium cardinale]|uniref:Uncharacterized protein n=1 Tax=Seiridium cardinale TaxID=138064 RepID=A0ABR2XKE9_9PEZI